ncbi:MAG: YezD family protein [Deltaproteobacteria bacterium]
MSTQHREGVNEMVATEKLVKAGAAGRVGSLAEDDAERVLGALRGLRFGTVTVIVHDGAIVQVERTEKLRLPRRTDPG